MLARSPARSGMGPVEKLVLPSGSTACVASSPAPMKAIGNRHHPDRGAQRRSLLSRLPAWKRCTRASTRQTSSSTCWPANTSPPTRSPSSRPMRSGFDTSRRPMAARYPEESRVIERRQILATMGELSSRHEGRLRRGHQGRRKAVDEPQPVVGDLLEAEIAEKQARSISTDHDRRAPLRQGRRRVHLRRHPMNENLVRELAGGSSWLPAQRRPRWRHRNRQDHLAIAIARACIRDGARDTSSTSSTSSTNSRQRARRTPGRVADYLSRIDFIVLDELGYLPFARSGGQPLLHLISRLMRRPRSSSPQTSPSGVAKRVRRRRQNAHRAPRPAHPSLRVVQTGDESCRFKHRA